MAAWQHMTFASQAEMLDTLNGAIISPYSMGDGLPVDGLNLIINVGGAGDRTVTFAPAKGRDWTADEIVAQIVAAHGDLAGVPHVLLRGGTPGVAWVKFLRLVKHAGAVITVKNSGTANALFGFPVAPTPDLVGVVYATADVVNIFPPTDTARGWTVIAYV